MSNRSKRAAIAKETLSIIEAGNYVAPNGSTIELGDQIQSAIDGSVTIAPDEFETLYQQHERVDLLSKREFDTNFVVKNMTTFASAQMILKEQHDARIFCLNFASAKNPGGGFLGGSQAQEEALSRASALYACLNPQQKYYTVNRKCGTCLYTDHMIYSPKVPVFRNDEDQLLNDPYRVSILTSPAVNTGALANSEPDKLDQVSDVMMERIEKLLSIAVIHGYEHLVLGAWGCGVFRNDPAEVAKWFHLHLVEGKFKGAFRYVVFGVLDFSKDETTLKPFVDQFV